MIKKQHRAKYYIYNLLKAKQTQAILKKYSKLNRQIKNGNTTYKFLYFYFYFTYFGFIYKFQKIKHNYHLNTKQKNRFLLFSYFKKISNLIISNAYIDITNK